MINYVKACLQYHGMIKTPPSLFVDTSIQLVRIREREEYRRHQFEEITTMKATDEQQEKYISEMKRVVEKRQSQKVQKFLLNFLKFPEYHIEYDYWYATWFGKHADEKVV
jgi:hypothetical protein